MECGSTRMQILVIFEREVFIDSIGIENSNSKNNFIAQGLTFLGFLEFCLHLPTIAIANWSA